MTDREILPDVIHDITLNFDEISYSINGKAFGESCERFEVSLVYGGAEIYVRNCDGSEERVKYKRTPGVPGIAR